MLCAISFKYKCQKFGGASATAPKVGGGNCPPAPLTCLQPCKKEQQPGYRMLEAWGLGTFMILHSAGIAKEEVTEDVLPKGIPPFPGKEYTSCCGHVSLGICELRIVPCESAKVVYKSNLCTLASSIRFKLNKPPVYMYGLFMTLALTFFLCTEIEELLTLRQRVESLERDVASRQRPAEETGEEEEKVRLNFCVFYPHFLMKTVTVCLRQEQ